MKEITLRKISDKIIGSVRCSDRVFKKITRLARENGCTNQDIIRAILEETIDEIKFKI